MGSYSHNIIIIFLLRCELFELNWDLSIPYDLINRMNEKTCPLLNKKVKKKNHIPKYHTFSLEKSMKTIHGQLINEKSLNSGEN